MILVFFLQRWHVALMGWNLAWWTWCKGKGIDPKYWKSYWNFTKFWNFGVYYLRCFHETWRVCTSFQDALAFKIWMDLLKDLQSNGGYELRGWVFFQILVPPLAMNYVKFGGTRISPVARTAKNVECYFYFEWVNVSSGTGSPGLCVCIIFHSILLV